MLLEHWSVLALSLRYKLVDHSFVRIYSHVCMSTIDKVSDALMVGVSRNGAHFSNTLSSNLGRFLCAAYGKPSSWKASRN